MVKSSLFLIFAFSFLIVPAARAQTFPKATGRVNDFANVIDPATEADLDRQIDLLEQKTSSEIAVATVTSLDGMSVEEYANKLFKQWGIGQAKQDNGVLVLVAPSERKMRIEVGYGLEGVLPDGLAGEVIRDQFTPKFKNNDYSGGIKDGVTRLIGIVEARHVLTAEERERFKEKVGVQEFPLWALVPFSGVFVALGFAFLGVGIGTKSASPMLLGTLFGGLPLGLSILLFPLLGLLTLAPLAIAAIWFGNRMSKYRGVQNAFRGSGSDSSGWVMGTSSSSDSDSDSSSSSSDFGGGSSGGGGASGSW